MIKNFSIDALKNNLLKNSNGLIFILILGGILRCSLIYWGCPGLDNYSGLFHIDEKTVFDGALNFPSDIWSRVDFRYPTGYIYFLGIISFICRELGVSTTCQYILFRIISVVISLVTIFFVYKTFLLISKNKKYALISALFLAITTVSVNDSVYMTTDTALAFIAALLTYESLLVYSLKKLNLKSALILGLILGFLISIKYTGAIFGLLMLPIFLFSLNTEGFLKTFNLVFIFILTTISTFALTTPGILLKPYKVLEGLKFESWRLSAFSKGLYHWPEFLDSMSKAMGPVYSLLLFFSLVYLVVMTFRILFKKIQASVINSFLPIYLIIFVIFISFFGRTVAPRYFLLLAPLSAIVSALFLQNNNFKYLRFSNAIICCVIFFGLFGNFINFYQRLNDSRRNASKYFFHNLNLSNKSIFSHGNFATIPAGFIAYKDYKFCPDYLLVSTLNIELLKKLISEEYFYLRDGWDQARAMYPETEEIYALLTEAIFDNKDSVYSLKKYFNSYSGWKNHFTMTNWEPDLFIYEKKSEKSCKRNFFNEEKKQVSVIAKFENEWFYGLNTKNLKTTLIPNRLEIKEFLRNNINKEVSVFDVKNKIQDFSELNSLLIQVNYTSEFSLNDVEKYRSAHNLNQFINSNLSKVEDLKAILDLNSKNYFDSNFPYGFYSTDDMKNLMLVKFNCTEINKDFIYDIFAYPAPGEVVDPISMTHGYRRLKNDIKFTPFMSKNNCYYKIKNQPEFAAGMYYITGYNFSTKSNWKLWLKPPMFRPNYKTDFDPDQRKLPVVLTTNKNYYNGLNIKKMNSVLIVNRPDIVFTLSQKITKNVSIYNEINKFESFKIIDKNILEVTFQNSLNLATVQNYEFHNDKNITNNIELVAENEIKIILDNGYMSYVNSKFPYEFYRTLDHKKLILVQNNCDSHNKDYLYKILAYPQKKDSINPKLLTHGYKNLTEHIVYTPFVYNNQCFYNITNQPEYTVDTYKIMGFDYKNQRDWTLWLKNDFFKKNTNKKLSN